MNFNFVLKVLKKLPDDFKLCRIEKVLGHWTNFLMRGVQQRINFTEKADWRLEI